PRGPPRRATGGAASDPYRRRYQAHHQPREGRAQPGLPRGGRRRREDQQPRRRASQPGGRVPPPHRPNPKGLVVLNFLKKDLLLQLRDYKELLLLVGMPLLLIAILTFALGGFVGT